MGSLADKLRKDLEACGEYVVMANASTGWFAVFPTTWHDRMEKARRHGREGPNLVVYRTKSDYVRDHYVIPYGIIRDLLVEDTLTTSEVNGSLRWNLTFMNSGLCVSHRTGTVDVSKYHGVHLLFEEAPAPRETTTADRRTPGAGFGRSEENRKVEEAAVNLVSETYRQEDWQVVSVEETRCGFDLLCVRGEEEAHVEVKGVGGADRRFVITAGELRRAFDDDQFVLALVTSALSSQPVLERLPAVRFRSAFTFDPIQYWAIPIQENGRVSEKPNNPLERTGDSVGF
jgi:hypothetical protein